MIVLRWGIDDVTPPPADHAGVWLVVPDDAHRVAIADALSESERERRDGFLHLGARGQFLTGRWLLRNVLARLEHLHPRDVRLNETERGALELADDSNGPSGWHLNLSHTDGLVALAVARTPVGIDVEDRERRGRTIELADRFFAPSESAALRALPPERQRQRFFDLWTLKEAYIKARGQGLAIPLASFAFDPDRDPLGFSPQPGDPIDWRFARLDPTPRHRLAVALAR